MKKIQKLLILLWFYILIIPQSYAAEFALIPRSGVTGCDFFKGEMKMSCIPNYIKYLIEIVVGVAGTIAVIFIMVGGFKYILSAVSEDKEAGKETIKNAIIGLILTGLAWIIVNAIIALVTI